MATSESINPTGKKPPQVYGDWASDTSYRISQARYLAEAANALLHECEATDKDEKLAGVSFLLTMLAKHCDGLSVEVGDTECHVAKPAAQDDREASHG